MQYTNRFYFFNVFCIIYISLIIHLLSTGGVIYMGSRSKQTSTQIFKKMFTERNYISHVFFGMLTVALMEIPYDYSEYASIVIMIVYTFRNLSKRVCTSGDSPGSTKQRLCKILGHANARKKKQISDTNFPSFRYSSFWNNMMDYIFGMVLGYTIVDVLKWTNVIEEQSSIQPHSFFIGISILFVMLLISVIFDYTIRSSSSPPEANSINNNFKILLIIGILGSLLVIINYANTPVDKVCKTMELPVLYGLDKIMFQKISSFSKK